MTYPRRSHLVVFVAITIAGCAATPAPTDTGSALDAFSPTDAATPDAAMHVDAATIDAPTLDAFAADAASGPITAAEIRTALGAGCTPVSGTGLYAPDVGAASTIPICQGPGTILYWQSDMDVDCDGGRTHTCMVDPSYQPDTSATGSDGLPIDAETVPFIVIPLPSTRFRFVDHGIALGQLALVTYGTRWAFGVFADEGPSSIIGEASYAMASTLGIDPNPISGGVDSGVTFVVFTGASARITRIEDHAAAVAAGMPLLNALLGR